MGSISPLRLRVRRIIHLTTLDGHVDVKWEHVQRWGKRKRKELLPGFIILKKEKKRTFNWAYPFSVFHLFLCAPPSKHWLRMWFKIFALFCLNFFSFFPFFLRVEGIYLQLEISVYIHSFLYKYFKFHVKYKLKILKKIFTLRRRR